MKPAHYPPATLTLGRTTIILKSEDKSRRLLGAVKRAGNESGGLARVVGDLEIPTFEVRERGRG